MDVPHALPPKADSPKDCRKNARNDGRHLRAVTREEIMEHLYRDGIILEAIGRLYGLSRERVRQILSKRGIEARDGGAHVSARVRAEERWNVLKEKKDSHCRKFYGCPLDVVLEINEGRNFSDSGSPANAYRCQRRSAAVRGIDWKFTFPEWWSIWQASGKWSLRGRSGYCMSRKNDAGAYEVGNVEIITTSQNSSDSYKTKPSKKRREAISYQELTPRQKQIAALSSSGLKPKDIAANLGISAKTVRVHMCSINQKLGLYQQHYRKAA
jgi:DNA-binding CsgD family transcriptional regulator/predicted HTH domain antitoxin